MESWDGEDSKFFSRDELSCPCCKKIFLDPILLRSLNALRELADAPIKVLSGYRCVTNNTKIGGEQASYHCAGKAADIAIKGFTVYEAYRLALQIPGFAAGGIGVYPVEGFIHVDCRQKKARWARVKRGGGYVGIDEALNLEKKGKG